MQKVKNSLMYLVSLNLYFFLISCTANITTSNSIGQTPTEDPIDQTQEEVEAERIITKLETLHQLLLRTSEGRFVLTIAELSGEEGLALYLQGSEFDLAKMKTWVNKVMANIDTINTPVVSEKIEEIKALRDAATDPVLIARYDRIIERMENKHQVARADIRPLKTAIKTAISNLIDTGNWISDEFVRRVTFEDASNTAGYTELALTPLDVQLDRIED